MQSDPHDEISCGINLFQCLSHTVGDHDQYVLQVLRNVGCTFLTQSFDAIDRDPLAHWHGHDHVSLCIEHPLLSHDLETQPERIQGSARVSCWFEEGGYLSVYQRLDVQDRDGLQAAADGQLKLLRQLLPHVHPAYGYIDVDNSSLPTERDVQAIRIKRLMWANIFGAPYIARYGRDIFQHAPGWMVDLIDQDCFLYVLSSTILDREHEVQAATIRKHFLPIVPRIKLHQRSSTPR